MTDLIDTTEMYLRTIYELEEEGIVPLRARIAERLGHSGPTVSQTVARMERDGLLGLAGDRHLELSVQGRQRAVRVMRKHRLAERLLVDVLGLEWEYVHEEACRWEHVVSERVERKILGILGEHRESPYGNPIPGLDELGEPLNEEFRLGVINLVELVATGAVVATVRRIGEQAQTDPEALHLLVLAGLMPGQHVRIRREGAWIVVVREGADESTGISLPQDVAAHVYADVQA
ncbi:MAG: DtxR family transcriptional regulator, Mn-dependent transcriptional regulator [Actinomycetota bacterium]|nr:DtxR family transcriptional regulator, Mn-dependent transcriptional regulator [Actinomycetota bacterium]